MCRSPPFAIASEVTGFVGAVIADVVACVVLVLVVLWVVVATVVLGGSV